MSTVLVILGIVLTFVLILEVAIKVIVKNL